MDKIKVVCVDPGGKLLTKGKIYEAYEVVFTDYCYYEVNNDDGKIGRYFKSRFEIVNDYTVELL